ncbi:ATP-binding protein [Streptomyces hygroscopicus]|uniref:ATP-binding protein n=1 Tax=Streptomyces hygroscopicus TaxID=1912 RepID=UPI00223F5833|nr:ATP-binding protein [Streptomyces hygroscopicus]
MPEPPHNRLDLASTPSAIRYARLHAEDVLGRWPIPATVKDDALLIVDELIANAVLHAHPEQNSGPDESAGRPQVPGCSLLLRLMPDHLLILVHDQDRRPPVLREPSDQAESGRGLLLVAGLSAAWGYTYPAAGNGKSVWARVHIASDSPRGQVSAEAGKAPPAKLPREVEPSDRGMLAERGAVMSV